MHLSDIASASVLVSVAKSIIPKGGGTHSTGSDGVAYSRNVLNPDTVLLGLTENGC